MNYKSNLEDYIKNCEKASSILQSYGETFSKIQFNEENQAIELFALTSLRMSSQHFKSISILLKNGILSDCFIICRNIIELCFNLRWAEKGKTRNEVLDRTYQLEAKPLKDFDTEIKEMEKCIGKEMQRLSDDSIIAHINLINEIKGSLPYLLEKGDDSKLEFRTAPSFANRMGDLKIKYYHIYRFVCMFAHPSPKLKEYFMKRGGTVNSPMEALIEPLGQVLTSCLLFSHMLMLASGKILADYVSNNSERLITFESEFLEIYNEVNKNLFH